MVEFPVIENPPQSETRARIPAQYYSEAPSSTRRLCPAWVPFGCGGLAIVAIVLITVGGYWAGHGGLGRTFDFFLGQSKSDVESAYTADVTPAQRQQFDATYERLRAAVRAGRVDLAGFQKLLQSLSEVARDKNLTPQKVDVLTRQMNALIRSK